MKYSKANTGRTFILRLEDGEIVHETIEEFASSKKIKSASVIILGSADKDSKLIVGPEKGRASKINPVEITLNEPHEISGTGTIFPDKNGKPVLHMHIACGRGLSSVTGCARNGIKVWYVAEVIITELTGCNSKRLYDEQTGFELLSP